MSTALSLNLAGMITNCQRPCIANPVVRLYAIDIEKNKESTVRIGIDLGGTKTEVIALGDDSHNSQCLLSSMIRSQMQV